MIVAKTNAAPIPKFKPNPALCSLIKDFLLIKIIIPKITKGKTAETHQLKAVASSITGEKAGDTSQFEVAADSLKGVKNFEGVVPQLTLLGQTLKDIEIKFPEGNE